MYFWFMPMTITITYWPCLDLEDPFQQFPFVLACWAVTVRNPDIINIFWLRDAGFPKILHSQGFPEKANYKRKAERLHEVQWAWQEHPYSSMTICLSSSQEQDFALLVDFKSSFLFWHSDWMTDTYNLPTYATYLSTFTNFVSWCCGILAQ